jgi:peptidoglycan LD-endopeptidase CwlK
LEENKMSEYKLSRRSLDRLQGVDERLVAVVNHAITVTKTDFGVIQGMRTLEQQKELVAKGASQTMKSKHLDGLAVDLMAYINGRGSWELNLYDDLADAMAEGANAVGCKVRWGAAWNVPDIGEWRMSGYTSEQAMNHYVDARRKEGRRPFIDGPHFELMV